MAVLLSFTVKKNDDSDLPEVDQNTNKNLRSRTANKAK